MHGQQNIKTYYIFWLCVCSLSYLASKARAPYNIVICVLSGYAIFFNGTIYGKVTENEMYFDLW